MKSSKAIKAFLAAVLAACLAVGGAACSKGQGAPEAAPRGTFELSAVCEGAPEATLSFVVVGEGGDTERMAVEVNGPAARIELAEGSWEIRCAAAPKTTAGEWVFCEIAPFAVEVSAGMTASKVLDLDLAEGVSSDDEVVEEETGEDLEASSSGSPAHYLGQEATSSEDFGSSASPSADPSNDPDDGSEPSEPNPEPSAHSHSWVWVPDYVTVVDEDAWDEPVYRAAYWCPKCNCEVSLSHNEEMLNQEQFGHSITSRQVIDYCIHHDAITHTEDRGHYECSGCGAWQ